MCNLKIAIWIGVIVADQTQPVSPNGNRAILSDYPIAVQNDSVGAGAGQVIAVRHLQILSKEIVIADQAETIHTDRDRCVTGNRPGTIEGGDGEIGAGKVLAVCHSQVAIKVTIVADQP